VRQTGGHCGAWHLAWPCRVEEVKVTTVGEEFAGALASKQTDALIALMAEGIDFRAMTPGRFWEAASPQQVVDILYQWFEPSDVIEELVAVGASTVVDRHCVDYRLQVRNADGVYAVEQRAYYDVGDDGRISLMRVMCSGYRSLGEGR
jgi:hypothetical protein